MTVNNNTPDIRFNGFAGNWELKPLENIFARIRNAFVGTATPYYVKKGHFYLESNNIKNGLVNRNTEVFINDEFHLKQKDKWLKTGDIVMVQSGHVGHSAVIPKELNNTAAHALIMFTDRKQATNPYFLNYQFSNENTKLKIDKITTGNTIKHILSSDMKIFECYFPVFEEQNTIGNFFQHIDETITLSRRKYEKTKTLKKSFLNKMFPQTGKDKPEIRLKGFSGDWVEKQLGDLSTVQMCKRVFKHETKETGQIPFYKIGTFGGVADAYIETALYEDYKKKYPYPQASDILISASGTIGRLIIYSGENAYYQDSNIIWLNIDKLQLVNSFLFYFYQTVKWNKVEGSTIKRLYNSDILSTTIKIPKIEEQAAIGQFFKQLDDTLALQIKRLKALENLKKALLAKMFV